MESNTQYKAALYCRLSKDDDSSMESTSISTQKLILESYCNNHGFQIYDYYIDDGYSGTNFDRPSFERMLNDIDNGKINMIITKDLSRLGRDYIKTGYYTEIYFKRKEIRYIAVNDNYDSEMENDDIVPFKNILNDMYSKDISRKIKSSKREYAKKGYFTGAQPPYGYVPSPEDKHKLIVDKDAADVVKKIYTLASQGHGAVSIAKILSQEKILIPSAHKFFSGDTRFARYIKDEDDIYNWRVSTILCILRDRVYLGEMINHKCETVNYKTKQRKSVPSEERIVVKGTHEAIITQELFDVARENIHSHSNPRDNTCENIFRGILKCRYCGYSMSLAHRPNGQAYYRCMRHYRDSTVKKHTSAIYYDELYKEVLKNIKRVDRIFPVAKGEKEKKPVKELTTELLNRYVDKIVVSEKQKAKNRVMVFWKRLG